MLRYINLLQCPKEELSDCPMVAQIVPSVLQLSYPYLYCQYRQFMFWIPTKHSSVEYIAYIILGPTEKSISGVTYRAQPTDFSTSDPAKSYAAYTRSDFSATKV